MIFESMIFSRGRKKRAIKAQAQKRYAEAASEARRPVFYERYGVPDSFDGRFEMLCLQVFLALRDIRDDKELSQALFDEMFVHMDQTLRETGVGDLSMRKHMKRMMEGFHGRALAYEAGLLEGGLEAALERNVYGTSEKPAPEQVRSLAQYVRAAASEEEVTEKKEIRRA